MEAILGVDPFNLCWNALFIESKQLNGTFFSESHCNCKLIDSRDINYDVIENRLAYTYKYGCFNISLLEKCISNFLNEYPAVETVLPLESLRVCSLSNGPGLDVVGLLCALYKSNKHLKSIPSLKAVNFYKSWCNLYKLVVHSACHIISLKSNLKCFNVPSNNISLIQEDVFSTFSAGTKKYISESNVLLMVKVFASSKATPTVFENSLKEIFSFAKPGTLIFFVGSKQNTKRFSEMDQLKQYVKCIFGPQKVSVDNLPFDESITNSIGTKPLDNGYADFMVWQKSGVSDTQIINKVKRKRKKRRGKKKKNSQDAKKGDDTVTDECVDDSDVESEMSFTSESMYSDALSDDLKSDSNSNVLVIPDVVKSELECNLSKNRIESLFDKINIEDSSYEKKTINTQPNITSGKSYLESPKHEIEYETTVSANKFVIKSLNSMNLPTDLKSSEISLNVNPQLQDNVSEMVNTQNIKCKTSNLADLNTRILSNLNKFKYAMNDEISETLFDVKPQVKTNASKKNENVQDTKFETSSLLGKINSKISGSVNPSEGIQSNKTSKMSLNVNSPLKKGNILEYSVNCASATIESVHKMLQSNLVNSFTQAVNRKDIGENTCSKKSKNKTKNIFSELKVDNGNIKKQSKSASQKLSSKSQSCENLCNRNVISENTRSSDNSALLQECQSLVTSLEKLTAEIKNIFSSKDTYFIKKGCSTRQACGDCSIYHSQTNCVHSAYRCACIQMYSCQRTQNSCRSCSCSFPCESSISRFDDGRPQNISRPYITIPLENEDLLRILTSKK